MIGRHAAAQLRRRWAPTALAAITACTPPAAILGALALAGDGYLVGRVDVAAAGAVLGAAGLLSERLQAQGIRRRLRRERARHRVAEHALEVSLTQARREAMAISDVLRSKLLNAVGPQDDAPTVRLRRVGVPIVEVPVRDTQADPLPTTAGDLARVPFQPSPIHSGPIVIGAILHSLEPGPSVPLAPAPNATASGALASDALVYAALADASADELTRTLERPGRHSGLRLGASARDGAAGPGTQGELIVVRSGRHVA